MSCARHEPFGPRCGCGRLCDDHGIGARQCWIIAAVLSLAFVLVMLVVGVVFELIHRAPNWLLLVLLVGAATTFLVRNHRELDGG